MDFQSYSGLVQNNAQTDLDKKLERLKRLGYFTVENVLSEDLLDQTRRKMDAIWSQQASTWDEDLLRRLGDWGQVRCMMEYDPYFFDLLSLDPIEEVLARTTGDTSILHLQNGIIVFPDSKHNQGRYHKDFPKNFTASTILSINTFIVIDDFTSETGGTWLVPGSHLFSEMPSPEYLEDHEIQFEAKAGTMLVFDSTLWHRGGINYSSGKRRGINMQWTKPFIKQQLDYPVIFKDKVDFESRLAQKLGMWTIPPKSISEYRVTDPKDRTYRAGQG